MYAGTLPQNLCWVVVHSLLNSHAFVVVKLRHMAETKMWRCPSFECSATKRTLDMQLKGNLSSRPSLDAFKSLKSGMSTGAADCPEAGRAAGVSMLSGVSFGLPAHLRIFIQVASEPARKKPHVCIFMVLMCGFFAVSNVNPPEFV